MNTTRAINSNFRRDKPPASEAIIGLLIAYTAAKAVTN